MIANRKMNASICYAIQNSTLKAICTSEIFTKKAFAYANYSYYRNVSGLVNSTIAQQVVTNVTNATTKNISLTLEAYSGVEQSYAFSARDFCYIGVGYLTGNMSVCGSVSPTMIKVCMQVINERSAVPEQTQSLNYSRAISACAESQEPQICIQAVTLAQAIETKNVSFCGKLSGLTMAMCYGNLAKIENNQSICYLLKNSTQESACLSEIQSNVSS